LVLVRADRIVLVAPRIIVMLPAGGCRRLMTGTLIGIGWLYLAALPGGLPGAASKTIRERPAHMPRVSIEVIRAPSVTVVEVDAIRDQITRIWSQEGVEVGFSSFQSELGEVHLRLALADTAGRRPAATRDSCAFGSIRFINGTPEPEMNVFVSTIREFVRNARPVQSPGVQTLEAARIMGRVAAHEMGHYLLADARHQPEGLMRARFDGADLLAPHLKPFRPPSRRQFAAVARIADLIEP